MAKPGARLHVDVFMRVAFVLFLACSASADVFEMGEEFRTVTTEVVTPHVAWARPLASGKLRLLVIAPRFAHRETAELMQRLDAECDVVMTHSHQQLGASAGIVGMRENEILDSLRDKLSRPHDAIVVGNLDWAAIPKPIQYEILRQVSEGTGLLYVPYVGETPDLFGRLFAREALPDFLLDGVPWGALPSLEPAPSGSDDFSGVVRFAGTLKRGRCLVLRWNAGAGGFHCLTPEPKEQLEYDYDMALVARAVLWLAQKEPKSTIQIRPDDGQPGRAIVDVTGHEAAHVVEAVVRDRFHEVEFRESRQPGEGQLEFVMPAALKGGRHFIDVWVREGEGGPVVTWGTEGFDVERDGAIATVETERSHCRPGEEVRVTVTFASAATGPAELVLSALDIHGREWARATQAVEGGTEAATASFVASGMLSTYNRLRADLVRDGKVIQRAFGDLYVPLREGPDFSLGAWGGGGSSWLSHCRWKWAHDLGLTTAIFEGDITAGVRGTPYSTTNFRHGGKGEVRDPCLTDPAFWEKEKASLTERATSGARADLFAYSLGDEICLDVGNTSVCRSPTCLAQFRQFLRDEYRSLDNLNAAWGTDFGAWEEVEPKSRADADKSGNLAPWLDHRIFMDGVFTRALARARDIIHEVDPEAAVGAEGLWGSASAYGMDWWQLTRELDYLVPYWREPLAVESIRSFRRPGTITGTWYGNYGEQGVDDEKLRWFPWNVLLNQYDSVWWYPEYRAVQFGAVTTALAPDYRATEGFRATTQEIADIRSGVDTLLLNLDRQHDGIGVLYSRPSIHVWGPRAANELLTALEDTGLQYKMVPASQLSAEGLWEGGYGLLILPGTCVLSAEQVSAITAFVEQGGAALAILSPGVYDEHGRPLLESSLAPLFGVSGVERTPNGKLRRVHPADGEAFEVSEATAIGAVPNESLLATFDDGAPAAVLRAAGQGKAVLLGFSFKDFTDARTLNEEDLPMRSFLRGVLQRLGVSPAIEVVTDQPLRGLEIARFRHGANEYVMLTLEPLGSLKYRDHGDRTFRLRFAEKRLTYDVRARQRVGAVDGLEVRMRPGDCRLFARLSGEPSRPSVSVMPSTVRPGGAATVRVAADQALSPVLRMTVVGPDEREIVWWSQSLLLEAGAATAPLNVALNDSSGEYTVTVRDVATGNGAEAIFAVTAD